MVPFHILNSMHESEKEKKKMESNQPCEFFSVMMPFSVHHLFILHYVSCYTYMCSTFSNSGELLLESCGCFCHCHRLFFFSAISLAMIHCKCERFFFVVVVVIIVSIWVSLSSKCFTFLWLWPWKSILKHQPRCKEKKSKKEKNKKNEKCRSAKNKKSICYVF